MDCRFCSAPLGAPAVSLGHSPISNAYLTSERLLAMEPTYPLELFVCASCHLVQLPEFESPQSIFGDYAYFSSFSDSWLEHAKNYVSSAIARYQLDTKSQVVELASNDGYLLQYFRAAGIPVLGVEPAANVARAALEKGIPTEVAFFGKTFASVLAKDNRRADLVVANNVLAHVPDLNDFVAGIAMILKPEGHVTAEFPHLLRLIEDTQYDTIYHEHFSYFSLATLRAVFAHHGMRIFDVEELSTHGGSLRVHACLVSNSRDADTPAIARILDAEREHGLLGGNALRDFNDRIVRLKHDLLGFLLEAKGNGHSVCAYGAPAKGNTLLNYCGIRPDLIEFTVDRNPRKQDRFLPGSHIPIHSPEKIAETKPDFVLILPWNLREEIADQLAYVRGWGGKLVTPIPTVQIF